MLYEVITNRVAGAAAPNAHFRAGLGQGGGHDARQSAGAAGDDGDAAFEGKEGFHVFHD